MTTSAPKFKELMSQLKEGTQAKVVVQGKKKLDERYTFNQGWYDALLNTDMALNTHPEAQKLALIPDECRQIVEIGIYEGASSCFWSDFYLSHPYSRLISIDPFTGSEEHHAKPENYPELDRIELTARGNIAKSDNAAKIEIVKDYQTTRFDHGYVKSCVTCYRGRIVGAIDVEDVNPGTRGKTTV